MTAVIFEILVRIVVVIELLDELAVCLDEEVCVTERVYQIADS